MSWFVVGGVAIGATAGAIVGSKKGGDDVWKDALIGGAIGGTAGYGAGALGAAEAAVPAVAAEGALPAGELVAGGTGIAGVGMNAAAPIAGTSATMLPGATSPLVGATAETAAGGTGLLGAGGAGSTGIMGAGGMPAQFGGLNPAFNTASYFAPGMQAPVQMVQTPAATEYAMFGGDTASTASNVANQTPSPAADSPLKKGFESAKSWLSEPKNAMLTGVLGLGALSMFNNDNENNFGQPNVQPAGYPLSPNFKPSRYQPTRTYAGGGPVQSGMYPQSQYDKTQFAVPSQMPISREVIDSDYDTMVNPYTGEPPRFAKGGDTNRSLAMIDPRMKAELPETPDWVRSRGVYRDEDPDTKYEDALTAAQTRMGKAAKGANVQLYAMQKPTPMGKLNLGPVAGQEERKATGGIASLGGYAHGGNPHLLRGPGDGMSDDIPATIADKQPARLADGEFVVPADVVSGLGNGSTEAGAKKLHQMMDKVRVDRTGTKKQGKEIKAEKYLPGAKSEKKASGGIAGYAEGGLFGSSTSGQVVVQNGQLGTVNDSGEFTPLNTAVANAAGPATTSPNLKSTGYNPDYYNLPFYQNQLAGAQEAVAQQQGLKSFDPAYYLAQNTDVAAAGVDPWKHYQEFGIKEGRSPYEGGQAGAQFQDPAALAAAQAKLTDIQGNIKRLESSPVRYDPYTISNRPSAAEPQFYGNIYRGATPDYSTPGYTLGGNLGRWNNVAGEAARAAQPASMNQQVTQAYLQSLGRAPETAGFNHWMRSGLSGSEMQRQIQQSPEAQALRNAPQNAYPTQGQQDYVTQAYQNILGRAPDQAGFQNWTAAMSQGMTPDQLTAAIKGSDEAKARAAQPKPEEKKKARKGGIMAAKK